MFGLFGSRKARRRPAQRPAFRPAGEQLECRLQPSTTYFVATNGLDSNPGTMALPLATLQRAATLAQAGDTVDVRGGIYSLATSLSIGHFGTAAAPIDFQSYTGETAVIDGSQLPAGSDTVTIGGQYIIFQNFEVRNGPHHGISVWGGSHIQLLDNVVHDNQYAGIFSGYSSLGVVSDIRADHNTVFHNCLVNSARTLTGGWPSALGGQRVSGYTITNNTVFDNYGEGIDFSLDDQGLAAGNTVHDNYSAEMYLDNATHVTLEQNLVYTTYDSAYYRTWGSVAAPAASFQAANEIYSDYNPCNYDTVINNIAIGGHWGFHYGNYGNHGGLKNFLIANNTFYSSTLGSLIRIEDDPGHLNTVIANNIFDQTGGTTMIDYNGSAGISFSYNLWSGGSAALAAGTGDVNADPQLANPGTSTATGYMLTGGSPAIDHGTTLAAVSSDYFGTPRPQLAAYDIGAHEYVPVAHTLVISGWASARTAGAAGTFTVTAQDGFGRTATGYTGTLHFTSSDTRAVLPADYTFTAADQGAHTFTATLLTAGAQTLTATDSANGLGGSAATTVSPAAAAAFTMTTTASTIIAGIALPVTVSVQDAYGNAVPGYTGTVHFTSSDPQAVLPPNYTFSAADQGVHTFSVTLKTAGNQTVAATDTVTTGLGGHTSVSVTPAAIYRLTLTAPTSITTGTALSATVTAQDLYQNTVTSYQGTIHFTSTDAKTVLPANYTFTATDQGMHTFSITLKTIGAERVTAADTLTSSITGSATVQVQATATHFSLTAPASATAGTALTITVTALDSHGNLITGYTGTVHFSSKDAAAVLPANYTFTAADQGVHTFSVVLKTAGLMSVTASDTRTGITGSASVQVRAAAATHFSVTAPVNATAGTAFHVTVKALDAYGNTATGYTGTVHFTSTDAKALLPGNYMFLARDAGSHVFSVTLKTGGSQTLTVTDTVTGSISGGAVIGVGTGPLGPVGGQGGTPGAPNLAAPPGPEGSTLPAIAPASAGVWSPAVVDLAFAGKSGRHPATTSAQALDRVWEKDLL